MIQPNDLKPLTKAQKKWIQREHGTLQKALTSYCPETLALIDQVRGEHSRSALLEYLVWSHPDMQKCAKKLGIAWPNRPQVGRYKRYRDGRPRVGTPR